MEGEDSRAASQGTIPQPRSVSKECSHAGVNQDPLSMHSFPASLLKSTNRISTGNLCTVLCRGKEKKKERKEKHEIYLISHFRIAFDI